MIVIVCVDDRNGMLFNRRRVSRDRVLIDRLVELCGERVIRMNAYSASLFEGRGARVIVDERFLDGAGDEDVCFVENQALLPYEARIHTLILCRWNRAYPSDFKLDLIPEAPLWRREQVLEFAGSSHEKITVEVYEK